MINKIILASRSGVRKEILNQNGIICKVIPADIKSELNVELIDEVFRYVTSAHSSSNTK